MPTFSSPPPGPMEDLDLSSDDEYDGDDLYDIFSPQEIEASQLIPTGPAINIEDDDPSDFVFATQASLEEELEQASSPIREQPSVRALSKTSGRSDTRKEPPLFPSPMKADLHSIPGSSKAVPRPIARSDASLSGTNAPEPLSTSRKPPTCVARRVTPPSPSRHPYKQPDAHSNASSKIIVAGQTSPPRRRTAALKTGLELSCGKTTAGTAQPRQNMVTGMSVDRNSASERVPPSTEGDRPVSTSEISLSPEQTKVLEIVLAG